MVSDPPSTPPGPPPESSPPSGGLVFEGTTQITGPVIGGNVQNLYVGDGRDRQQRLRLADLVDNFWISRVLGPAGAPAGAATPALIPLAKRVQAAVMDGNRLVVPRTTEQPGDSVPESTPILDIFTRLGSLLIVGAPGAGKTTTLYELARAAVRSPRQDAGQLVPIVVNLTSWAIRRQPIATWLVGELAEQY